MSKQRLVITAVLAGASQSATAHRYGVSQSWISQLMTRRRHLALRATTESYGSGGLQVGRTHARTHVKLLIQDLDVTVISATTGEVLRELTIDLSRDYQPTGNPKGPTPKTK